MNRKYELTNDSITVESKKLHRIRALVNVGLTVKVGDLGGYIEREYNLSQTGDAWIGDNAKVYGNARILENAFVSDDAQIYDCATICGNAHVGENAQVYGLVYMDDHVVVRGNAQIYDGVHILGNSNIFGDAQICGTTLVYGDPRIGSDALVQCDDDYAIVKGLGSNHNVVTFFRCTDGCVKVITRGHFEGTIDEFRECALRVYKGKVITEILLMTNLMEMHFDSNWRRLND